MGVESFLNGLEVAFIEVFVGYYIIDNQHDEDNRELGG